MAETLKLLGQACGPIDDTAVNLGADDDIWVRQLLLVNPVGSDTVYVGGDSTVSDLTGVPIAAGASLSIDPNKATENSPKQLNLKDIWVVCATGETSDLRMLLMVVEDV